MEMECPTKTAMQTADCTLDIALRRANFIGLTLFCVAGVIFALYMQYDALALPCPLCIFQRVSLMACGALSLLAAVFPLRTLRWFFPASIACAALCGAGFSIRHIQVQASIGTENIQTCGAGLDFMIQTQSLPDVVSSVLSGYGDCTRIDWQMAGVTLPMLALAGFVMIIFWGVFIGFRYK